MLFGGETGDCPHCGNGVQFVQQQGFQARNSVTSEPLGTVTTSVCPSCQGIVVFVVRGVEDWDRFPLARPRTIVNTPPKVGEAFTEAQLALAAGAPHAAATMLRRAV